MDTLIQYWDEKQGKYLLREASEFDLVTLKRTPETQDEPGATAPPPEPTTDQLRTALAAAGMTDAQIAALFAVATSITPQKEQ